MPAKLALIAHDGQKDEMADFVQANESLFSRYHLVATETTGQRIQQETSLQVEQVLSGSVGGDAQIAAMVATSQISAVIFFIDPLQAQPHEPEIQTLQRVCAVHNVALATNRATADAIAEKFRQSRIAHLIFNPVSGQGNVEQDLKLIQELLEAQMQVQVHLTTPEIGAEELAQTAIASNADLIIASGGDGTVSVVAGEIMGTGIPLGIIPRGTANAFAVALNIAPGINPIRSACETILAGNTRVVDAARCNDLPLILLAGIGYEAETIERTSREAKNRWGALAYIMAGWQQLNEQELFETEIEIEGTVQKFQAGAITIANAAPPTSILAQGTGQVVVDDGLLDVTISTAESRTEALTTMIGLFGAALVKLGTNSENTVHFGAKQIRVIADPPQKIVLDGEIIGTTPVEIECHPGALKVFAPPAN
ncbi:methylglyoxal synthase [Lusitaniella coriacea LEGE 07157]|uniref:Methylglyoxal synthase n=1 Tax=Lusitaniella coriacea LEGE 07157 TaxID=945747 RepID=A0A8J7B3A5_9CYAN|nr:methylglyoxal synthase [Lusitaniella coriacea]MBE9114917.1 methylglyoxal synthase [Lusitaniella coriacea LEGE 07157]